MGRGKIEIQKIENLASRQVTFTKRRKGLMKKAHDLSILCNVQVGVIVNSSTGKIYEHSSPDNMKSMLEQYNAAKEESQLLNATSEAMLWKLEAQNLCGQVEDMRNNNRQLLGENLSDLSIEHLEYLENQVEISTKAIRARKEQLWKERINELNQKEISLHQENMALHKEGILLRQQVKELQSEVYGGRKEEAKSKYDISNNPLSIELDLSLSRQEVT